MFLQPYVWEYKPSVRQDRDYAIQQYGEKLPTIKYSQLILRCDTLDILLFSGSGIFSVIEQFVTNSIYSHIGMIYKDPVSKECYNWESTTKDENVDVFTGEKKCGPRLIELYKSISSYIDYGGNYVVYRKLFTPQEEYTGTGGSRRGFTMEENRSLVRWMKTKTEKMYEMKIWQLPAAHYKRTLYPRDSDPTFYFCSELVADTWKKAGIPSDRQSDLYSPQDFSQEFESIWTPEARMKGYSLGKEYRILLDL